MATAAGEVNNDRAFMPMCTLFECGVRVPLYCSQHTPIQSANLPGRSFFDSHAGMTTL